MFLASGGGGTKRCAEPRVREPGAPGGTSTNLLLPPTLYSVIPEAPSVLPVDSPSGGGDGHLHNALWSEAHAIRCQWVPAGLAQAASSFLGLCCSVLIIHIPSDPSLMWTPRRIFLKCHDSVSSPHSKPSVAFSCPLQD